MNSQDPLQIQGGFRKVSEQGRGRLVPVKLRKQGRGRPRPILGRILASNLQISRALLAARAKIRAAASWSTAVLRLLRRCSGRSDSWPASESARTLAQSKKLPRRQSLSAGRVRLQGKLRFR